MKDRSGLCAFTFADGRQCRSLRRSGRPPVLLLGVYVLDLNRRVI